MKKVLTFGVFDYFHYGHLRLLERAKKLGDYLIVAVQRDEQIQINKPGTRVLYNLEQRCAMISALKCVDEVVPYSQVVDDIKTIDFDLLVLGGDQNHAGLLKAREWAESNGKEVIILDRTPNISSTEIRSKV